MQDNTDPNLEDGSITEAAPDEVLEQDNQQETAEQVAEQVEESAVTEAIVAEEPKTRGERRSENYIDKLSEQIRSSSQFAYQPKTEPTTRQEYQPLKYEEGDFDLNTLEKDRSDYGQAQRDRAIQETQDSFTPIKQQIWAQQLEFDDDKVKKIWNILDERDEDNYDPDFAKQMFQKYVNFIGYNRNDQTGATSIDRQQIRWIDFVQAEKQNLDHYVQRAAQTSTKNIVKQATNTGIRPSGQARVAKGRNVNTEDPNWISKLTREEYNDWGRELSDQVINKNLGII